MLRLFDVANLLDSLRKRAGNSSCEITKYQCAEVPVQNILFGADYLVM